MALTTKEEFERARAALLQRSPQELVDFILSLAHAENGIGNYVHTFVTARDPKIAAGLVQNEIDFLRRGEREYNYRHRQGAGVTDRLERVLDTIELALLPADPGAAFEMLTLLIKHDGEIAGHCHEDDYGASEAFGRACELLLTAGRRLTVAETDSVFARLVAHDEYGLRGKLAARLSMRKKYDEKEI